MRRAPRTRVKTTNSNKAYQPSELPALLLFGSDIRRIQLTELEANELAKQAGQGNQEATGQLYDAYVGNIYYYFYRRTKNRQEAEDLTSETFTRALKRLRDGTWPDHPFRAWLFGIAKNVFLEWLRKQSNTNIEEHDMQSEWTGDEYVLEEIHTRERCAVIWSVVNQLPEAYKYILELRYLHDLSYIDIASTLGKQIGACKALHYRAMKRLRGELKRAGIWNALKRD